MSAAVGVMAPRRGRPRAEVWSRIAQLVEQRPAVALRDICTTLQCSLNVADTTVRRMRAAGELDVVGTAPGAKRAVALYGKPLHASTDYTNILHAWAARA